MSENPLRLQSKVRMEMDEAERKAFDSLARYKFQMFGFGRPSGSTSTGSLVRNERTLSEIW